MSKHGFTPPPSPGLRGDCPFGHPLPLAALRRAQGTWRARGADAGEGRGEGGGGPVLHLFISASLFLFACGKPEPPAAVPVSPPTAAVRILAFGDSLTAGKDLEDPDREAYPAVLERLLKEAGHSVSVTNAGHSGDTTFDALARLDFSLAEKPHIVIVGLGSNDTFQGKKLTDMEKNLDEIVRRCQKSGAVVVLCGMKTFPNLGFFYASDYAKMFKRVADRGHTILVPFMLEGVVGVPSLNLGDMIHPNSRGQERVARNILPHVEKAFKKLKG